MDLCPAQIGRRGRPTGQELTYPKGATLVFLHNACVPVPTTIMCELVQKARPSNLCLADIDQAGGGQETGIISGEDSMLLRTLGTGGLEKGGGGRDKHSIRRLNKPSKVEQVVAPRDEDNKAVQKFVNDTYCHGHHEEVAEVCEECTCL